MGLDTGVSNLCSFSLFLARFVQKSRSGEALEGSALMRLIFYLDSANV